MADAIIPRGGARPAYLQDVLARRRQDYGVAAAVSQENGFAERPQHAIGIDLPGDECSANPCRHHHVPAQGAFILFAWQRPCGTPSEESSNSLNVGGKIICRRARHVIEKART